MAQHHVEDQNRHLKVHAFTVQSNALFRMVQIKGTDRKKGKKRRVGLKRLVV